ncbi:AraC family ligand binding domain-containing protein [Elizabethkingia anophelis]
MSCSQNPINIDDIEKPYFVWFEDNWVHDDELHSHQKGQLVYVESGFQYLTVEGKIYLLPQNHAAWIPSGHIHKTNSHSEKIRLMIMFFDVEKDIPFYNEVSVFLVPPVLKEMIKYAEK